MSYTLRVVFLLFSAAFASVGCVSKKLYRAENNARAACDARELVLQQQLNARKKETQDLIQQVAALNKAAGYMEKQLTDLLSEAESKSQKYGSSFEQLNKELAVTQNRLKETQAQLSDKARQLDSIERAAADRLARYSSINTEITEALMPWMPQNISCETYSDRVEITLPDRLLFDAGGYALHSGGRGVLTGFARFLTQRPELNVEIHAHTDYKVPKIFEDSYAWANARATGICRLLIKDCNVNANQLVPVARGEFVPVASNATEEGRLQNLRTVLVVR